MNKWVGFSIALVLGLVIGIVGTYMLTSSGSIMPLATRSGGYTFINPLLACDTNDGVASPDLSSIKSALSTQVASLIAAKKAKRISIYVRDMDSGVWTGVNVDDTFAPASLLKVPIMIAVLKDAEDGEPNLADHVLVPASVDENAPERIKPAAPLKLGESYSIAELLTAMVEQSDNNALFALQGIVSTSSLEDVFSQFSVPVTTNEQDNVVSPHDYMRFFRILYNGTYLTHTDSQRALDLLAHVGYDAGLDAGVPDGVPVAHKFGEREVLNQNGSTKTIELHDCGIVYYPHSPYGICIMTEGADIQTLQSVIQTLSSTVYAEVQKGALPQTN